MKKYKRIYKIFIFMLVIPILSSCSTYSANFTCGDASGASCYTMDSVDKMITTGEIEQFNKSRVKRKIYKADKDDENIQVIGKSDHLNEEDEVN